MKMDFEKTISTPMDQTNPNLRYENLMGECEMQWAWVDKSHMIDGWMQPN